MNEEAYEAFYESVEEADSDPVRFQFTEEEVAEFDISRDPQSKTRPLWGKKEMWNLSKRGYPYLRSALIFEVMSERLK